MWSGGVQGCGKLSPDPEEIGHSNKKEMQELWRRLGNMFWKSQSRRIKEGHLEEAQYRLIWEGCGCGIETCGAICALGATGENLTVLKTGTLIGDRKS